MFPYPFWDSEFDILKPKKNAKETGCLLWRSKFATYLSSGKERIHIRRSKIHLKEGQKKTLDKFEIIRKLKQLEHSLQILKPIVNW
jgi:hypothetical protein